MRFGVAGDDTCTMLLIDEDTKGRYSLIDMHVPPGTVPPPHPHDFEETRSHCWRETKLMFRGKKARISPIQK